MLFPSGNFRSVTIVAHPNCPADLIEELGFRQRWRRTDRCLPSSRLKFSEYILACSKLFPPLGDAFKVRCLTFNKVCVVLSSQTFRSNRSNRSSKPRWQRQSKIRLEFLDSIYGISPHVLPSSSRPVTFFFVPPHC
jgi:hypothetical protein